MSANDSVAVDILMIERMVQCVEDRGETEAVVQAAENGAVVIADDPCGGLGRALRSRIPPEIDIGSRDSKPVN